MEVIHVEIEQILWALNLKSICFVVQRSLFLPCPVQFCALPFAWGYADWQSWWRPSAHGYLEMGAGLISLVKALCRDHLEEKSLPVFELLGRRKAAVFCAYTFIVDLQSWNRWKLMFLKCWKDFSLQLAYRTKELDISPEIPPDLSKAPESFLLIWEGDKPLRPDMYKCKLVLPGGLFRWL